MLSVLSLLIVASTHAYPRALQAQGDLPSQISATPSGSYGLWLHTITRFDKVGKVLWSRKLKEGWKMVVDGEAAIVAGTAEGDERSKLWRINKSGETEWTFALGKGVRPELLNGSRGKIFVISKEQELSVAKVDATDGRQLWKRALTKPGAITTFNTAAPSPDGGIAIVGPYEADLPALEIPFVTVRLASNGKLNWARTYNSKQRLYCPSAKFDSEGDLRLLVGEEQPNHEEASKMLTYKRDGKSVLITDLPLHRVYSFAITSDGANLISGASGIGKFSETGSQEWIKSLGMSPTFVTDSTDNSYVLRFADKSGGPFVVKLNSSGTILWSKSLEGILPSFVLGPIFCTLDSAGQPLAAVMTVANDQTFFTLYSINQGGEVVWRTEAKPDLHSETISWTR